MKKFLPLLFTLFYFQSEAQQQALKFCGADEMRIEVLKNNPDLAKAVMVREEKLNAFTKEFANNNKKTQSATYIIPVVFHIIHNYGSENISDAQIKSGIEVLNKYYRKQMADTSAIVGAFKPLHADCEIEFRLAKKDPNGNCSKGINRIASPYTYTGTHDVKSLIHWDPTKYLNIYVVSNAAGLAGHCVWPSDADTIPAWDGIVITHSYVGEIGTSSTLTRVSLSHEVGHYFNLQHTWGGNNVPGYYYLPCADPNKDCNIDDGVSDTPVTIGWQTCNLNGASCGSTLDNVQNFMEYSYCNKMFTYGQKTRMHACLNSPIASRNNLWQPANLIATGVDSATYTLCAADFNYDKQQICAGSSVNFSDASYNTAITTYNWSFPGGTPSTSNLPNPTVVYSTAGIYNASLTVTDATSATVSVTKNNIIEVIDNTPSPLPFAENFESYTGSIAANWSVANIDNGPTWQLATNAGFSGTKSIYINNAANVEYAKDELISNPIDMSASSAATVRFRYAYAPGDSTPTDKLVFLVSSNCDGTWSQRLSKIGPSLATAPLNTGNFIPTSSQWLEAQTNIPPSLLTNKFRLKFAFEYHGGNNIYLDNINIETPEGIRNVEFTQSEIKVIPNPAKDNFVLNFWTGSTGEAQINIYDVCGKLCYSMQQNILFGENNLLMNIAMLSKGAYVVNVVGKDGVMNARFVKGE